MIETPIGQFTGTTWEAACQLAFKSKHGADGYQQIPASPGDYGIEGFTKHTGYAFQCYCPERLYEQCTMNTLFDGIASRGTTCPLAST